MHIVIDNLHRVYAILVELYFIFKRTREVNFKPFKPGISLLSSDDCISLNNCYCDISIDSECYSFAGNVLKDTQSSDV